MRDDSAERLLTAPGSVSLPRTHCRLRLLRLLVVKLALPLQLSHLGMHSDAHQNRAERAGLMFMLKEEIDKSVTQLLRPDPKLLKPKLTIHSARGGGSRVSREYRVDFPGRV